MQAEITLAFNGATAASSPVFVALDGATLAVSVVQGVTVAMTSGFTNVAVTASQLSFATMPKAQFGGTLQLQISWNAGTLPAVTLANVLPSSNPPTVSWPTASGPQHQVLSSGDPMSLSGIIGTS